MKTIYTVIASESGLMTECFTNIKSLFNFLERELYVGEGTMSQMDEKYKVTEVKYSYSNLVKVIRHNQDLNRFTVAVVETEGESFEINHLNINSK